MATTKKDIRRWFERGVEEGATHLIVVCDTYDYEDYPVYVKSDEICQVVYENYNAKPMQKVMEIYDLKQDMETQLSKERSWST